jgi:hypothetical protein
MDIMYAENPSSANCATRLMIVPIVASAFDRRLDRALDGTLVWSGCGSDSSEQGEGLDYAQ